MKNINFKRLILLPVLMQIGFFAFAAINGYPDETLNNIRKNRYLEESARLQQLANQSFAGGDYDKALKYASDAVKAASMSDIYTKQQLKIYTANNKMNDAFQRLAWADLLEAKRYFPAEFYDAKTYYNLGLIARDAKKWDDTINNADKVIQTLAAVTAPPEKISAAPPQPPQVQEELDTAPENKKPDQEETKDTYLPARYIVRSWDKYGDCFWNIAGRSWVYGDPHRWPILYQANRKKLPDPDNPNLIEPGMVIDIPSINGEIREGLWDSGKTYSPLNK
ncbi:MAG: LysM peptidoglycan-binding domain-containing protein [Spirochaetaceae bacterium]|jgi:tetratricopeptide (TPR) repeat protein|nr:LysM peptidoglycan-binding domain-containing protein [Spirochaetaceae bacterium]